MAGLMLNGHAWMGAGMVAENHYDAVIVGSGFGGSVMAFRLAEAGMKVCVLERGKEFPPGSYPRSPAGLKKNFWDPSEGQHGMFNFWSFKGLDALVSSGVGGGSLIYANVLLRKDEKWFVQEEGGEYWPIGRADLDPHYDIVERMIDAQRYPFDHAPYSETPKTIAMKDAAQKAGLDWKLPNLAVVFGNTGQSPRPGVPLVDRPNDNMYGVPRYTCRLCGECNVGCNYGSKSTLDLTYLSQAKSQGAEIASRCEVRAFRPTGEGYTVDFVHHASEAEGTRTDTASLPVQQVTTKFLILSAGALGSTYLLLKMKATESSFEGLSKALGTRFSGNGDVLTFVLRTAHRLDPTIGPTITSAIRMPDELDGDGARGRGFYVEDAGFPAFVSWLVEYGVPKTSSIERLLSFAGRYLKGVLGLSRDTDLGAEVADLFGDVAATAESMPLLIMGRDIPNGRMFLNPDRLDVDWEIEDSAGYVERVERVSKRIARALEGDFAKNPLTGLLRRLITVHPLGGCPMGRGPKDGVIDDRGQVFGYPRLFVADGSVMPGPVGPNPSLTIAALADRFADRLIDDWNTTRSG